MRTCLGFVLLISVFVCRAQNKRTVNGYATFQFTRTVKDITRGNNPWALGTGIQVFFNVSPAFRPTAELSGDLYLENDKVGRGDLNGELIPSVRSISKLLAGPSVDVAKIINLGVMAGPSFVNSDVLFTLKPYLNLYLNEQQTFFIKAAYIHVYNRGHFIKGDFTSNSLGIGFKVF